MAASTNPATISGTTPTTLYDQSNALDTPTSGLKLAFGQTTATLLGKFTCTYRRNNNNANTAVTFEVNSVADPNGGINTVPILPPNKTDIITKVVYTATSGAGSACVVKSQIA